MDDAGHGHSESGHGVKDWTQTQQNQITSLYKSLHGPYQEIANKQLFGGQQLPYEQAHHILTDLLSKQEAEEHGKNGLEHKVESHANKSATSGLDYVTL